MENVYNIKATNLIENLINLLQKTCLLIKKISIYTIVKYIFTNKIFF